MPSATRVQNRSSGIWVSARFEEFIGNTKVSGVPDRHHQRCCLTPDQIHVLLFSQPAYSLHVVCLRQTRRGGEPKTGHTCRMRCSRPKVAKKVSCLSKTTELCQLVRRHLKIGGTNGRVCASLKQDANSFDMARMPRRGNPKLQSAAQRGLTPVRWRYPVWISSSVKKARHFRRVTCPAGFVEQLPFHRIQSIAEVQSGARPVRSGYRKLAASHLVGISPTRGCVTTSPCRQYRCRKTPTPSACTHDYGAEGEGAIAPVQ
jgi:hypothetical protein